MRAFPSCKAWLGSIRVLGLLLPLQASAQHPSDTAALTEDYFLGDTPVVLSASRLAQPVSESPASMTIIDRDMIEASGAIDIPDVLRLVPGFQVSHISGQNQTAQYHGLANQHPKRMQVLIDGRSVYHSAFGGVHWDTLPVTLDDIDRIEVLRGSNASTFGSNAFMGVINIVTRKAVQDRGTSASVLTGYNRTREATLRFGDRVGALDYRITLNGFTTDGFPNYRHTHTYWDSTGVVAPESVITGTPLLPESTIFELARNDSQRIGRFNLRGDYLMSNGDALLVELGYAHNDRNNTLDDGKYEDNRPDENLRTSSQFIKWSRLQDDGGSLSLQFSHNRLRMDTRHTDTLIERAGGILLNVGPVLGGGKVVNDRFDLELENSPPEHLGWRVVWGAGLRIDSVDSSNFIVGDGESTRTQYRLFANVEKHFGAQNQWIFNAGAMLEHQSDQAGIFVSPRIALNFHGNDYETLRVAASRAYRMPSFSEQYGEHRLYALNPAPLAPLGIPATPFHYLENSNAGRPLDPERLDTLELGLFSMNRIDGLSIDIRAFRERLRNYIDEVLYTDGCNGCDSVPALFNPHDFYVNQNAGWMDIDGVEVQLDYDLSDRTRLHAAISRTHASGQRIKSIDTSGNVTETANTGEYIPEITASALLSHRFDRNWSGSIAYYRMSKMNWPNDGDRLKPYDRVDLRLARKFDLGGHDGQIELIGQNVRNQEYSEFRHDNRFERRLYLRMRLALP